MTSINIIVVTRPDYEIGFSHITDDIKQRIIDLRNDPQQANKGQMTNDEGQRIYITDAVQLDISATEIRQEIKENETDWRKLVPVEVAKYIKKYDLYI